jgi:hypothetical protein
MITGAALWGVAQFIGGKATDAIVDKIESTNWGDKQKQTARVATKIASRHIRKAVTAKAAKMMGKQTPVTMSQIGLAAIQFGEWEGIKQRQN